MTASLPYIQKEQTFGAGYYVPFPVVLAQGQGVWLWDVEGKRYLDMMAAYSAASHGHSHPRLLNVLREQAAKLCVPSRTFYNDKLPEFLSEICHLTGLDKVAPMNTGAEAVETAIKAARRWGYEVKGIPKYKAEIIVAENNFHGRTTTILSFSSAENVHDDFGPFTPGFKIVPFGDAEAVQRAITPNTCAVLFEPIQGEGGIIVPPNGWLKQVADICRVENVLLFLDEIQSGLGRAGDILACHHDNVQPDGVMLGKALGGGILPISAFVATTEVMDVFFPGSHGSTYGGNPLAAAVGSEALKVLQEEKLVSNSATLGLHMHKRLKEIQETSSAIKEIRGRGLWAGIEVNPDVVTGHELCLRLIGKGVLCKETRENTIRFSPPLVIKEPELDWALDRFAELIRDIG